MTTPKPIDLLTPEELRVECAEAMGWKSVKSYKHSDGSQRWKVVSPDGRELSSGYNKEQMLLFHCPNYPADANAALTLAHALAEKGWLPIIEDLGGKWSCDFAKSSNGRTQCYAATATGPHAFAIALCKAFLEVDRAGKEQQG